MFRLFTRRDVVAITGALALAGPRLAMAQTPAATPAGADVVADGLTNPRGVTWGADGTLYLALAGTGVAGPRPEGSGFAGGLTSSVVTIADGEVTTLAEELPSSILVEAGWVWGAMDVAILGDQLYVLDGGGGAIHGNADSPSGVYQVNADGTTNLIADLGTWVDANPVAKLPPEGFPNNGSFFAMIAGTDSLWVSEAVNGQILKVTPAGGVSRLIDLSDGHMVPAGLAPGPDGGLYVGFETVAPYPEGAAKVGLVAADGTMTDVWTNLTAVTAVTVDSDGTLYAAEMSTGNLEEAPFLRNNAGRIVRQSGPDSLEVVADGLDLPVALDIGPDWMLYVSLPAFGANDGEGSLIRLDASASLPIQATPVS